jgi:type I restriction enzyme, S subunit
MSKNNQNKLIPTLRFPEFSNDGEWEEKALNKLGKLVNGLTYSPDDVKEEGLLVLRSSNIQNGLIVLDDNVYVRTDVKGVNLSEPNDILICVRNGSKALIGKNALIPTGMPLCTHGAFMTVFRSDKSKFIFQLFQTKAYTKKVAGDLGATINSINGSNFLKYEFLVPKNPDEQNKIAACLSSLDEVITAESQKLVILQNHKKGLLQNLLPQEGETVPKFRFKEFEDSGDWQETTLTQVATFVNDKTPLENLSINSYISTENLLPYYAGVALSSKLPPSGNFTEYRKGDVLVSNIRPYLKKVWFADKDGACSNDVIVIRANSVISEGFISLLLRNDAFINYIMKGAEGVKMPRGDKDLIREYPITFPKDKTEQKRIVDTLSSLDYLINAQSQKVEALMLHKKGMLQGLFPTLNDEE